ncbi:uncharacterized protein LOC133790988 isoform X2 [Humulus lupulus]|uniref:uncharacterized protein LOC133790988 isoform X2 n=1 Tax=Humulus lupulus TaxID=3486 RepID=UPI002B405D5D|nr:uncharacterized protein LOC133790988 isoform X2 [Humulus lupulus]
MSITEFILQEVPHWDDELLARARFKAFSGQRSDWQPIFLFWRDLILNVARHFHILLLRPSQVKDWFNRGGLTPLCLDHVLVILYQVSNLWILQPGNSIRFSEKFREICGGTTDEASALFSFLSSQGKARHLSVNRGDIIQGVKVSLSRTPVSSISSLDCDVLHLIWTTEKLEQQHLVIDQRCERSRKSAIASLNSGNKNVALRHMRALKLANNSREKCTTLLNRVEEVLTVIGNAESTKKVTEAIRIGAQAIKENKMSVEEVQHSLEELEESIDLQKQVENALESTPLYTSVEDEDIEEEFNKLELEIGSGEDPHRPIPKVVAHSTVGETEGLESAESLTDLFSNLKVADDPSSSTVDGNIAAKETKTLVLEAA